MLTFLLSISEERNHPKIEYLFNKFHSDMIRLAKYRLKQAGIPSYSVDAEDAVQNAFVKIVKYIDSINFEASEQEIKAYVLAIVSNETKNIITDYKYFEDVDDHLDELSDTDFIDQMKINERYDQVVEKIEKLDDKYSMALLFHYRDGMSVKEIADRLGLTQKNVYARLERGKKYLLELLRIEGV